MLQNEYRIYLVDLAGRLAAVPVVQTADRDEDVVKLAEGMRTATAGVLVWCADRLVVELTPVRFGAIE